MEYYIETNSFAAPFFSDNWHMYVEAGSPEDALNICANRYSHPCGLYAAAAYSSSDAKNKGEKPLARWLSNQAQRLTQEDVVSVCMDRPGEGEINGKPIKIDDPKAGCIVP